MRMINSIGNFITNTWTFSKKLASSSLSLIKNPQTKTIASAWYHIATEDFLPVIIASFSTNMLQQTIEQYQSTDEHNYYLNLVIQETAVAANIAFLYFSYLKIIRGQLRFIALEESIPLLLNQRIIKEQPVRPSVLLPFHIYHDVRNVSAYEIPPLRNFINTQGIDFYLKTMNPWYAYLAAPLWHGYQIVHKTTDFDSWSKLRKTNSGLFWLIGALYSLPRIFIINGLLDLYKIDNFYLNLLITQSIYIILLSLMSNVDIQDIYIKQEEDYIPNFSGIFEHMNLFPGSSNYESKTREELGERLYRLKSAEHFLINNELRDLLNKLYLKYLPQLLKEDRVTNALLCSLRKKTFGFLQQTYSYHETGQYTRWLLEECQSKTSVVKSAQILSQAQRTGTSPLSELPTELLTRIGIFSRHESTHERTAEKIFREHFSRPHAV